MNNREVIIIDYKIWNLFSVVNACKKVWINAIISSNKNDIKTAKAIILPGVWSFKEAMENLQKFDLIDSINDYVNSWWYLLWICLWMQLLFSSSEEHWLNNWLDIIKWKVKRFDFKNEKIKIPNIWWNTLIKNTKSDSSFWEKIFSDIISTDYMYFIHSYYVEPEDERVVLTYSEYWWKKYCSSISKWNIIATQFHPEKSWEIWLSIYEQRAKLVFNN
jgi:glutamine amidotransferase